MSGLPEAGLTLNTQNLLADFLKTGSFLPLNTQTPLLSSVRIMATCSEYPENLRQKGLLQEGLSQLFHEEVLFLPPLRKRKKDLRLIVRHLMERNNELYAKNVLRLEQEAQQRIMSYDWPGNYEELATTIERGVKLAQGETLLSENLFFGLKPLKGKLSFDLIKPDIKKGNLLNYALVPLLLGIELSFQVELLLLKVRDFLFSLNEHFALIWKSLTFSFDPKIIRAVRLA